MKWTLISIFSLILLLVASGFIIIFFYEDEIEQYFVRELNKTLKADVQIEDIEFSVFSKFPDASIEFINVTAYSPEGIKKGEFKNIDANVLFTSASLFLQFNIMDVFTGDYTVKKIYISDGTANVLVDSKGNDNYHIFKETSDTTKADFEVALKKITLSEMKLNYVNKIKNVDIQTYTDDFVLAGDLSAETYTLETTGTLSIDKVMVDNVNYVNGNHASLSMDLDVDNEKVTVSDGYFSLADLGFVVYGSYWIDKNYIDLEVKGKDINIQSFLSLLPSEYRGQTAGYYSSGTFFVNAKVKGEISNTSTPLVETKFGIKNGEINKTGTDLTLTNLSLDGIYSNGKDKDGKSYLKLSNFNSELGKSKISGNYMAENISSPKVQIELDMDADLEEIYEFFEFESVSSMKGHAKANLNFLGNLNNLADISKDAFLKSKTQGFIEFSGVTMEMEKYSYLLKELNGKLLFKNNDLKIDSLAFTINESDFFTTGYLKNLISYIMLEDQKISVEGDIKCHNLNVEDVIPKTRGTSLAGGESGKIILPDDINLNINLKVDRFSFGKFDADRVQGKVIYANKQIETRNFTFSSLQGNIRADVSILQNDLLNFYVFCKSELSNIDITKLFYSFNNFSQDFIVDKNLKGSINALIMLKAEWTNDLEVIEDKIVADGKVEINNGELVNFEPMERLSSFISLNELKHIRFERLSNNIIIKDRTVKIPEMKITSSALNLDISGEHTFDNLIDYKFKILLSEVLFKKAKSNKKENGEFGEIEDDGLGKTSLYLSMKGTVDDYKVTYDTKKVRGVIKENLQEEGKKLKEILNSEFGLYKKDSALIRKKEEEKEKEKEKNPVTIIWEDE